MENYFEISEAVLNPEYRRKKKEAEELEKRDPDLNPRYSKVMFLAEIPYARQCGVPANAVEARLLLQQIADVPI